MNSNENNYEGLKVTIMGLGLHGGGFTSAKYFASRGAIVTVTDLKSKEILEDSIKKLKEYPINFVLGYHNEEDFSNADLIIKNPAVPINSPVLKIAASNNIPIETDISIFLKEIKNRNPIIAVTGSKGKSTTATAIYYCLKKYFPNTKLGGNITVSPLNFLDNLVPKAPIVLELSSWQLADLKNKSILNPLVSLLTPIMPDHMDRYNSMDDYIADKKLIFEEQTENNNTVFNFDDSYQKNFFNETKAKSLYYSNKALPHGLQGAYLSDKTGYIKISEPAVKILPETLTIPGEHNRMNLLAAALACYIFYTTNNTKSSKAQIAGNISYALQEFPGIEHRLEFFHEYNGLKFYNDSAATIPQATAAAVKSIKEPVNLITGGTDKNIDFSGLETALTIPENIFLLKGTGTDKIIPLLESCKIKYFGPFDNLKEAVLCTVKNSAPGSCVIFSPGCTSFGMFKNEFDRGIQFKKIVMEL